MGEALQRACAALNVVLQPERVYVCLFGESLRHIHFFIIPRTRGMPVGSWGTFTWLRLQSVLFQLKLRQACSKDEIVQLVSQLRQYDEKMK